MSGPNRSVHTQVQRLGADERGVTAIVTAVGMVVILGFAGLAIDVGYWQLAKSGAQGTADRAAAAAGTTLIAGGNFSRATTQARAIAASSGFVDGSGGTTVAVNSPPTAGANQGNSRAVEVIITQPQPQWFTQLFLSSPPTVQSRAVAMPAASGSGCILALNPTANNTIDVAGNPTISAPDCVIVSDSNSSSAIHLQGSASVTAKTLVTPGNVAFTGGAYTLNLTTPAQTGAPPVPDPYASTLTHSALTSGMPSVSACTRSGSTWSGNCFVAGSSIGSGHTLSANTKITGGFQIKNMTVNLSPGTYWVTDGDLELQSGSGATLRCPSCSPGGSGVTIILTTAQSSGGTVGTLTLESNANLTLNAPGSGTFAGKLFIQDSHGLPTGTTMHTTANAQANATETVGGLLYFPKSTVSFQGGPGATGSQCLVLVADKITFQGNPGLAIAGCVSEGLTTLPQVSSGIRVVE